MEKKGEEIKERQDGFHKGSWEAARERAEPSIQKKTIQSCIDQFEKHCSAPEQFELLADWRKRADGLDKRILDSVEWFKGDITRRQLERRINDIENVLPDGEFEDCFRCGEKKMPVSDKRRNEGFRWECPECNN